MICLRVIEKSVLARRGWVLLLMSCVKFPPNNNAD